MSTQTSPAIELGAETDLPEHLKTYRRFKALFRYAVLHIAALLIGMAFGFFTGGGFILGLIVFVLISAVGYYLMR